MRQIALNGDTVIICDIRTPDEETGNLGPAEEVPAVTAYYSATDAGDPLDGTEVTLAEYSGKPGRYHGTLDETQKEALEDYLHGSVFEVITADGEIQSSDEVAIVSVNRPVSS